VCGTAKLDASAAKAVDKLTSAFAKAEEKGACLRNDAGFHRSANRRERSRPTSSRVSLPMRSAAKWKTT
jgi:hypothetical protein